MMSMSLSRRPRRGELVKDLRSTRFLLISLLGVVITAGGCKSASEATESREIRIPKGAGGVGFLPLLVMEKQQLIEKRAKADGIDGVHVRWIDIGGPSVVNDALLSGS